MRVDALDLRPGANGSGAVLAIGREDGFEIGVKRNRDVFPVALVGLPESVPAGAPVIERVEQPVADEIPRGDLYAGWQRCSDGNVQHAPVDGRMAPITERWCIPLVTPGAGVESAGKVESV